MPIDIEKYINVSIGNHFMLATNMLSNPTQTVHVQIGKILNLRQNQGTLQQEINVVTILTNQKLENT
jgi:hypothetical protein